MISEAYQHSRENLKLIEYLAANSMDGKQLEASIKVLGVMEQSFHHNTEGLVINLITFREDDGALDGVLKLPHVAGPLIGGDGLNRAR